MGLVDDIRLDLGDDSGSGVLTDTQYINLIKKSARRLNRVLCLTDTDDEISIDGSGEFIAPDDDDLRDLVVLQVECLVSKRDFNSELSSGSTGVRVVDGEQSIDTRNAANARSSFFNSDFSPCAELQKALAIEKLNRGSGRMIW